MGNQPTGTVTFLLTDIEGSTRLWDADQHGMAVALAAHDEIVRAAVTRYGGAVFSTAGDAFAAAFSTATDAIEAAVEVQTRLASRDAESGPLLRVRMGLHTGVAHERDGNYFGPVVNRAARIMAAGHGGQVLVSAITAALAERHPLIDLGDHLLKDLPGPQHLYQLASGGLRTSFPPLHSIGGTTTNLPHLASSFVGRTEDVAAVGALLRSSRLVTLTGAGGVGKTRLALHSAASAAPHFTGVWLVELAGLHDGASVLAAIDGVLVTLSDGNPDSYRRIVSAIGDRSVLVVLDNCEHLLDAASQAVDSLLARCPNLRVLATSREALGMPGEHVWQVAPLKVDGIDSPAVALFIERASEAVPSFDATERSTVDDVVKVCRALDGLPLAIELAAARMTSMTPADVADRLDDRLRWRGSTRDENERHQTLARVVAWSYGLLSEPEKACLRRLSVFADGFDLAAAHQVLDPSAEHVEVTDIVGALVRKSLLTVERSGRRVRYGLLETIRSFASVELAASEESAIIGSRHAALFAASAAAQWDRWDGPGYLGAVDWFDANQANLLVAYQWSRDVGDIAMAADIAAYASMLGLGIEAFAPITWAEELVPAATAASVAPLPRLLSAAGLCGYLGRAEAGADHARRALQLARDPSYESFTPVWTTMATATALVNHGDIPAWFDSCETLARGSEPGRSIGQSGLLFIWPAVGRHADAAAIAEETLAGLRAHENPFWIAYGLLGYGRALADLQPNDALRALREALVYTDDRRVAFWGRRVQVELAGLEILHGDVDEGVRLWGRVFDRYEQSGTTEQRSVLARIATLFDRLGHAEIAATLVGAVGTDVPVWASIDLPRMRTRSLLGDSERTDLLARGGQMRPPEAIDLARRELANVHGRRR